MSETSTPLSIVLENYEFALEDPNEPSGYALLKGRMEVSYDGELLGIDTWEIPRDQEFSDNDDVMQSITLVGSNQANLLVAAILALLEARGDLNILNDQDIQAEVSEMVQETKDAYAEKAFKQICDGLQAK